MDKKNEANIYTPKTSNRKETKINNNIPQKQKNIGKKNINININKVYLRKKDFSKSNNINRNGNKTPLKIRKTKALSNNNIYTDINNTKQEKYFDIKNILNKRNSELIQNKKNNKENIYIKERLTLKRTIRKKLKEINLTKTDINDFPKKLSKNKTNLINQSANKNKILSINNLYNNENAKEKNEILRRTNIPINKKKIYENLYLDNDTKEKNDENEIKNNVVRHNTSMFILEKNNFFFDDKKNKKNKKNLNAPICQINTSEHELDKFFKYNSNVNNPNNELIRFSNISNINKNDVFYLNNRNILFDNNINVNNRNMTEVKNNNYLINNKIETIEGNESQEILDFEEKILEEIGNNENHIEKKYENENKNENKVEQIVTIPCLICNKLINIDEADEHSNKCYNNNKKNNNNNSIINKENSDNFLVIIHNKLKNILEYLEKTENTDINNYSNINSDFRNNSEFITELKSIIIKILNININEINSSSIDDLLKINTQINIQMEKCLNSPNIFTLFSRAKILLEEKSKFFSEKIGKNGEGVSKKNLEENSLEENNTQSETTEFFDLKKMEKILDEKDLKTENLEKLINETKNKRLFLMEVLKVKFQKINENKKEDLIPPEMIWKEAVKKNVEMKNWTQFIFNELNNPNKYLKMLQKKNIKVQKKK